MENKLSVAKTIKVWKKKYPLLNKIIATKEVFWTNPNYGKFQEAIKTISLSEKDVADAEKRLKRFAPYIAKVFPETRKRNGIIESCVIRIPEMNRKTQWLFSQDILVDLLLICDSHLAVSGSVKARGGIYEVLKHAEDLAVKERLITFKDNYSIMATEKFKNFFSKYSLAVGSTGNLGLSIGIMGTQLGFRVYVHMSADAKKWKKDLLKNKGATVVEYDSDYNQAVEHGRRQALADPLMHFIDDENSQDLFLGYSVAAGRLKNQLKKLSVTVDEEHPLFVYLPCGVGGGPGGICFGLKLIFKDNVHCFFAEPTHSPCMLLGLMTRQHDKICVQDFGIDNVTQADGLAVGRPSAFVGKTLKNLISGVYTVEDELLYILLKYLFDTENIFMEPSAIAGIPGPTQLFKSPEGKKYLQKNDLTHKMKNAVHIVWGTGGSMVPPHAMDAYKTKGRYLSEQ
jgi:D-serine dehydratase